MPPPAWVYTKEFQAGWGTMDFNGHMANTAYLDLAADVRMAFFAEHGFPPAEFRRLAVGPVMQRDEVAYFREVGLHETVICLTAAERARRVRSTGGWLDQRARTLVEPPPELLAAFREVPRSPDFGELPTSRSKEERRA